MSLHLPLDQNRPSEAGKEIGLHPTIGSYVEQYPIPRYVELHVKDTCEKGLYANIHPEDSYKALNWDPD